MRSLIRRIKAAAGNVLRGEQGNVTASFVFVIFTALMVTTIVGAVTSSLAATSATSSLTGVGASSTVLQSGYLDAAIHGTAVPAGEQCEGVFCSQIAGTSDTAGIRTVTVTGRAGDKLFGPKVQTLHQLAPTLIAGYDSLGRPLWATQQDTTPYRFSSVVSRGNSSCAIDADKAAWCWGANNHGQLGDGTTTNRPAPTKVQGSAKFISLAGTGNTFCGVADDGKAWCWGSNSTGQLGTGNAAVGTDSSVPVNPSGAHTFTAIYPGPTTTCGIGTDKVTLCWGANPGNGTAAASADPVAVSGTHDFTALTMDASTACGLESGGKIFCWSVTATGRTGVDPAPAPGTPVEVAGGRSYTSVQTANDSRTDVASIICAVDTGTQAWCWGANSSGQLGNGTTTDSLVPVAVTGSHSFRSLTASPSAVCGIDASAHAWCWGDNSSGQLGIGSTTAAKDPAAVDPGTSYAAIGAATDNGKTFCALITDGTAKCWGENGYGQASAGSTAPVTSPAPVAGFKGLRSLSTGAAFSCVTDARSEASCWGHNDAGQAGSGAASADPAKPAPAARKPFAPTTFTGYVQGGQ
ncbi:MAG TPA: chromosome condensation regulator RCC1 [Arthrobacter sp.]